MKTEDKTPITPEERGQRYAALEAARHGMRLSGLPMYGPDEDLFAAYVEGDLEAEEVIEALHRRHNRRRFPEGPDGPEVVEEVAQLEGVEVLVCEGTIELPADPPAPLLADVLGLRQPYDGSDPWLGRRVRFTAQHGLDDEDRLDLN
ncbi:hypothetical protein GO986_12575 [Deinococcus sp. HMF7620]|uniref:Antitoxin VbhA domain-containing protein n=1 Tax=Deinococcus arboris TaxID=2682977 RepID=A0A7C9LRT2_9DEIO|nr:antitoxin VbhA family protein [Deinococcus arboris]MVN87601.1 hypothetical protein [Deinococcus arboris]